MIRCGEARRLTGHGREPRVTSSMFRASEFEFRHRFWFIGGLFWLGFSCYSFDHENSAAALAKFFWGHSFNLDSPADAHDLRLIFAFAALLAVLAAAIRTWAAASLHSTVVHDHALHSEALVADGPFRWMRNPLYLGGVLLAACFGLVASRLGWFLMTFGHTFFYHRLIGREEAALTASQGKSFRAYCAAVPRFFPSLRPRVPSSGARPRWGQAFAGEIHVGIRRLRRLLRHQSQGRNFLDCHRHQRGWLYVLLGSPPLSPVQAKTLRNRLIFSSIAFTVSSHSPLGKPRYIVSPESLR